MKRDVFFLDVGNSSEIIFISKELFSPFPKNKTLLRTFPSPVISKTP